MFPLSQKYLLSAMLFNIVLKVRTNSMYKIRGIKMKRLNCHYFQMIYLAIKLTNMRTI